jgi:hypothetical protein
MEYKITLFAEDINISEKFQIVKINGGTFYVDSEGLTSESIGELIENRQENWKGKIREAIIKKLPPNPAISDYVNRHIFEFSVYSQMCQNLEKIYLEGLTLTFKIEISEISPEIPEIQEKIYNKEINLKKLSTGYLFINNYLITDSSDFIESIGYILERKVSVSYHYNQIKIKFDHNDKSIIIDKPFENINEIDINLIKKIAKQIMLDDVISEEKFII